MPCGASTSLIVATASFPATGWKPFQARSGKCLNGVLQPPRSRQRDGNLAGKPPLLSILFAVATASFPATGWKLWHHLNQRFVVRGCNRLVPGNGMETIAPEARRWGSPGLQPPRSRQRDGNNCFTCSRLVPVTGCNRLAPGNGMETDR